MSMRRAWQITHGPRPVNHDITVAAAADSTAIAAAAAVAAATAPKVHPLLRHFLAHHLTCEAVWR